MGEFEITLAILYTIHTAKVFVKKYIPYFYFDVDRIQNGQ